MCLCLHLSNLIPFNKCECSKYWPPRDGKEVSTHLPILLAGSNCLESSIERIPRPCAGKLNKKINKNVVTDTQAYYLLPPCQKDRGHLSFILLPSVTSSPLMCHTILPVNWTWGNLPNLEPGDR